jgi:alpha-L-rhamnosidase
MDGKLMAPDARCIWDGSSGLEKDYWLRFRGSFACRGEPARALLRIAADARYALWINGSRLGRGPGRHWPQAVPVDSYDAAPFLVPGRNSVAVLVLQPGSSTSQYVARRGGLVLALEAEGSGWEAGFPWEARLLTDDSWRVARQVARLPNAPRINVSQPYAERFDARAEERDWRLPSFDDSSWERARPVDGPDGRSPPWGLAEPDYPALSDDPRIPARLVSLRGTRSAGISLRVDYKEAFYPGDRSTADRLQSGCVATLLRCPKAGPGALVLRDRKWPAEEERFSLNGALCALPADSDEAPISLREGDNLLVVDLSGAYQRFSLDLSLSLPEGSTLAAPLPGAPSPFVAIGPFLGLDVGNIVCAEGFERGPESEGHERAMRAGSAAELAGLPLVPIGADRVESPAVKMLFLDAVEERKALGADPLSDAKLSQLCVSGGAPVALPLRAGLDTELLLDFGTEVSGYLEIALDASEGSVLDLLFFERLDGDRPEVPGDLDNTMRYIAREGRQSHYSELRRGFRYALLAVRLSSRCILERITLHESLYPVPEDDLFDCSDALLSRIASLCRRTARLCMEDAFVDCPGFEQAYWIGDARNCALVDHAAFGAYSLSRRSLLLAAGSLSRSSIPECHVPAGVSLTLTAWALLWLIACGEYWEETGERGFLDEIYPAVASTVRALLSTRNDKGLAAPQAWNMFDWAGMDTPYRGVVAHQNATLCRALRVAAALASARGERAEAASFRDESDKLARAFNLVFWDEGRGAYRDCIRADGSPSPVFSVQTNLLALLSDCVPEARRGRVASFVDDPPPYAVRIGSPFASFFMHERLAAEGRLGELFSDIALRWGEMIDRGAATAWETFLGFYEGRLTRSYCHGWSTGPLYFLLRYALGVRYGEGDPGRKAIVVSPACGLLSWCSGRVHTPSGPVDIEWRLKGGTLAVSGSVPAGLEYRLEAPPGFEGEIVSRIVHR